ncbi:hypothetical protein HY29_09425 [Hyphomonas beringensis]|uniref:DUF2164 domain-containing protein n=1 Tax=Hyphomonas beringensis TaxID=1280946 RepID=A0A062UD74_9PROT|nr:DUF2164 domain-containing protein [Hyphomonas beringensis]KCZ56262.1 hypothetical protein HY29_09425 [Hyphomonas beringensis]
MKPIELSEERREALRSHLQTLFATEFDETLSEFRADEIVALMLKTLGPTVYNQAVADVRAHLQTKLDDLDGEVWAEEDR